MHETFLTHTVQMKLIWYKYGIINASMVFLTHTVQMKRWLFYSY